MSNLRRIIKYLIPYKFYAVMNVVSNVLSAIFGVFSIILIVPMLEILFQGGTSNEMFSNQTDDLKGKFFSWLGDLIISISTATNDPVQGKLNALEVIAIGIFIVFLLKNVFRYLGVFFMAKIRSMMVKDLRDKMYDKVLSLPTFYFNDQRKGDLISRITNDVQEVESSVIKSLEALVKEPINIIMTLSLLVIMDAQLTLFIFAVLPVTGFVISVVGKSLKKSAGEAQTKLGEIISNVEETLTGLKIIKAFNSENFMSNKFSAKNKLYQLFFQSAIRKRDLASPLSEVLSVSTLALVLWFGGTMVIQGDLNASIFINYIMAFAMLIAPLKAFTSGIYGLKKGGAAEDRINEFLSKENPIVESKNAIDIKDFTSSIDLDKISFGYDKENPLFKDLSLKIKKGETVALVGQSGSGKTTLSNIIGRFYDVSAGRVSLDGHDLKDISSKSLRSVMSIVSQESILFHGTVAENIAFGEEHIDMNRVVHAAKVANAVEFIEHLDDKYETNIGEGGSKLSGGQKQRLCIARAVYKNPPILILDEATSALDSESEKLVQDALNNVMKDRTSIVIAHRLSTIQNADRIIVFERGSIIEEGNHYELLAKGGVYSKLSKIQNLA